MGSILSGITSIFDPGGAQKEASKSAKSQRKLADLQAQIIRDNLPLLEQLRKQFGPMVGQVSGLANNAITQAQQYDPAQESERALLAFDQAAKQSLEGEMGAVNSSFTSRGFNAGNASSDQGGASQDVLARRAFNRGSLAANLKMGEGDRKRAVDANAFNTATNAFGLLDPTGRSTSTVGALSAPASAYGNLAQHYGNQASQFDPSGIIKVGADILGGIKWPWKKKGGGDFSFLKNIGGFM